MRTAVEIERQRKILALVAAPSDRHALLAILREGGAGENEKEQDGEICFHDWILSFPYRRARL